MQLLATLLALLALAAGCGDGAPPVEEGTRDAVAELPASYTYRVTSSCGERGGLGTYAVTVVDAEVDAVEPVGATRRQGADPSSGYFFTIAELLELAEAAGPPAEVVVETGPDGLPTSVSIDRIPEAIDDEECYACGAPAPLS